MKAEFLEAGKIVGTHGVRGALRIEPWADSPEFLSGFSKLYLDKGADILDIISLKPHGRIVIASVKGIRTVEAAEELRNRTVYIKRSDADLPEGRYFVSELISCRVFDADSGEELGIITDVSKTGANDVWHIQRNTKEYLVPAIADVVVSVDIDGEKAFIRPLGGIFDED